MEIKPKLRSKALIKQNLKLFLEDLFLRNGFFETVSVGETNFYGSDISVLQPGDTVYLNPDATFPQADRVYQSAFKNWVHEEGLPSISGVGIPIVASGVTVGGTFYPTATTSGTFAHIIDYPNGRVIFNTALAGSPTVQAEFSYKLITVDGANIFGNENRPILTETSFKDNPRETGVDTYPDVEARTLPAIFIDVLSRENQGYELGTRLPIQDYFGVLHIWTRHEIHRDLIEDVIADEFRNVLLGINFNDAPDPLLHFGQKNPNFPGYSDLAVVWGEYFWRRIYLENISTRKDTPLYDIERSRIDFNARVYPNF